MRVLGPFSSLGTEAHPHTAMSRVHDTITSVHGTNMQLMCSQRVPDVVLLVYVCVRAGVSVYR